ncbi:DUF6624 domain-containing protein [Imperialibacter roseus]|uniref:DUF6624 domain-containing protein n=1 Tax=Imperialibacter roseus TaxID=1324217 RepID=A0ABZ0IVX8_9BACT|nr:DUF6624 domain-containing protein [Imperialibacter roseus]WOK07792.1 DUF6624 domain-containing protein [Imperialibacter roseus]|tara:strand:+ start:17057 stop:17686 length:630 start_codon:yes stop_codon:yes gene_type:complete
MKRYFLLIASVSFILGCQPKPSFDKEKLTVELDSILEIDQRYRKELLAIEETGGRNSPKAKEVIKKIWQADSSNVRRIVEIIDMVGGYPGESMVGGSAGRATFYVLQHAPDSIQDKYYDLIIDAASRNELKKSLAAMYQDRYLMHRGEPQIYGTQVRTEYKTDPTTGMRFDSTYVWPLADTTNIDSIRTLSGMGPLEEYLNQFGVSRWE